MTMGVALRTGNRVRGDAHRAMFGRSRPQASRGSSLPMVGGRPAAAMAGTRLYAIGDIHGRLDLLRQLYRMIEAEMAAAPALDHRVILLGDYIDRGPESAGVLDWLLEQRDAAAPVIALAGNHEDSMRRFLDDLSVGPGWLYYGGRETLESYGIAVGRDERSPETLRRLQAQLRERLPPRHLDLLNGLASAHVDGDYMFVHAGVRPRIPLDAQSRDDLLWIRDEFLTSGHDHGKVVVHGHTISQAPELRRNRIGIDTGAFATDVLTSVVLEGSSHRFLQT